MRRYTARPEEPLEVYAPRSLYAHDTAHARALARARGLVLVGPAPNAPDAGPQDPATNAALRARVAARPDQLVSCVVCGGTGMLEQWWGVRDGHTCTTESCQVCGGGGCMTVRERRLYAHGDPTPVEGHVHG